MAARILVIEDNSANLELMSYLLQAFGYLFVAAENGAAGIAAARGNRPDLIICDVQLPDMDGLQVVRQLKTDPASASIPVLAVTAYAMVGDRDRLLAAGFDDYVAKPIDPEVFVSHVERFLSPGQRALAPAHGPEAPEPAAAESRPQLHSGENRGKVLIVDDNLTNRDLLRDILEPNGFTVVQAASVEEAIALAPQVRPDIILTDLHMPDNTGLDLLNALKADHLLRMIPTIVISSSTWNEQQQRDALQLGASRFFTRPMEPEMLLSEIEKCLNERME